MNNNNENQTKQLSLNFKFVKNYRTQPVVIDLKAVRENKENFKKVKAISAILKEAKRLTW